MDGRRTMSESQELEQRLRYAGARVHEGKEADITALADLCIEAADLLVRERPAPPPYYLKWGYGENDECPTCGATKCDHNFGLAPCHRCHACR